MNMVSGRNPHGATRKPQDQIRAEMLQVLSLAEIILFNDIYEQVFSNMKSKGLATGGEEILRLRIYEKLQTLVSQGALHKKGKQYEVLPKLHQFAAQELGGNR
jgi:hypothetical protein